MNSLEEIASEIEKRDRFWLVSHSTPDGDSIGSLLALNQALESMGKETTMLLQDPVPHIYHYLQGSEAVLSPGQVRGEPDQLIFLDCADKERVGQDVLNIIAPDSFTINIDHHQSNTLFANMNYVQHQAAATAELIYELVKILGVSIDSPLANALYAGIIQDTGSFHHSNTTPSTFRTAADLLECGVELERTRINLFESKQRVEISLLGHALNSLKFSPEGKIAWMTISYQDAQRLGVIDLHPEGIINHTLMVEGVEVGLLFRETKPGQMKIGFRSKGAVDVSRLAATFGGGGHRQAAGAQMDDSLEECMDKVIQAVRDVIY